MKIILFYLSILFSTILFGQTESLVKNDRRRQMTTDFGLSRISDTLLIDQSEILVQEWLDYIYYQNFTEYRFYIFWKEPITDLEKEKLYKTIIAPSFLPDQTILNQLPEKYLYNKCKKCGLIKVSGMSTAIELPFEADSINNPSSKKRLLKYLNNPVVGISYEQVVEFCNWRTKVDSIRYFLRDSAFNSKDWKNIGPIKYKDSVELRPIYSYRLPTPKEFDQLNPNLDSIYNKKGLVARFNYKGATYSNKKNKQEKGKLCGSNKLPAFCFPHPQTDGIFDQRTSVDIQGNVAEMTSVKGIAKGGSYFHNAKDSYSGVINYYIKPELWLGFRCIAVRRPEDKANR
jgi:hypothetical protein